MCLEKKKTFHAARFNRINSDLQSATFFSHPNHDGLGGIYVILFFYYYKLQQIGSQAWQLPAK